MKICSQCGKEVKDEEVVCPDCGSAEFSEATAEEVAASEATENETTASEEAASDAAANDVQDDFSEQPDEQPSDTQSTQEPTAQPVCNSVPQAANIFLEEDSRGNGNVLMGILGAFLFSLIGGLLYFIIYQAGVIAGICGLIIFALANIGYRLFAKSDKNTIVGLIVSGIVMIVTIFLAEYVSVIVFVYFKYYKEDGIPFHTVVYYSPDIFFDPENREAIVKNLVFAYFFGIITSISYIVQSFKARKHR